MRNICLVVTMVVSAMTTSLSGQGIAVNSDGSSPDSATMLHVKSEMRFGVKIEALYSDSDSAYGLFIHNANPGTNYGSFISLDAENAAQQVGSHQRITSSGEGWHAGVSNVIVGTGDGPRHGTYNEMNGESEGNQYGTTNAINNSGAGDYFGVNNEVFGTGSGTHYGTSNGISGTGSGDHFGSYNWLTGSGSGIQYGTRNDIENSADGNHFGNYNYLVGSGGGVHYGTFSTLRGMGTGWQVGSFHEILNESNGMHFGLYNKLTGEGMGMHTGAYNELSGSGQGLQIGTRQDITNSGNATHYGNFNGLSGSGSGEHYGIKSILTGFGSGNQYGNYNSVLNGGNAEHYGTYNEVSGQGSGDHYGVYNLLEGSGTGDRYGIYSMVASAADGKHYAGFFEAPGDQDAFAAVFQSGNVVVNESGGDYDFRVESNLMPNMFMVDADADAVKITHGHMDTSSWGLYIANAANNSALGGFRLCDSGYVEVTAQANIASPNFARLSSTGAWTAVSDARLKTGVTTSHGLLAKALALRPVSYAFINERDSSTNLGFIAQEVRNVLPEMVESGEYLSVNYSGMSTVAIGAVQELNQKVEQQQSEIDWLKQQNIQLQEQLQQLGALYAELKTDSARSSAGEQAVNDED